MSSLSVKSGVLQDASKDSSYTVQLITGTNINQQDFYAYLLLRSNRLTTLLHALKTDNVDLLDYGIVLASGLGKHPPEEVRKHVQKLFQEFQ